MFGSTRMKKWIWMGMGGMVMAGFWPVVANAQPDSWGFGAGFRIDNVRVGVGFSTGYETVARTVVEPAVYETVARRIWRGPVYQDRIVTVEIPARFETGRIAKYSSWGSLIGYELITVEVEPAKTEHRTERVLVSPGYFETVRERVLVRPEITRVVYERVPWTPSCDRIGRPLISKARPRPVFAGFYPHPRHHGSGFDVGFRFDR